MQDEDTPVDSGDEASSKGGGASAVRRRGRAETARRRQRNEAGGRSRTRKVKLTEHEDARLVVRAEEAGMSVARWLAESGLSADVGVTREERREMLTELMGIERLLASIANNVNQIAATLNTTGWTEYDLREVAANCHRTIERTGKALDTVAEW